MPWSRLLAVAAFIGVSVPLFIGLGRNEMRSDEAIYSYAVERILETGDWLTPRSSLTDNEFLEKPPLKLWLVAGAMSIGVTPHDEFGMRVFDALFGAAAFGYVMAFGWRLAGPACGAISLLLLFAFRPLVFDHGLRSNNMEAALLLAYCGGLYHSWRWAEGARFGRLHALGCSIYFVLGFMTKFVAVAFLPVIALVGLVPRLTPLRLSGDQRKDWSLAMTLGVVLVIPWFIYETIQYGGDFWRIILGAHVYTRFTSSLDPAHLQPWYFYFTYLWGEFRASGSMPVIIAGIALALHRAWSGCTVARLLIVWWLVPLVALSLGTSKLGL